MRHLIDAQCSLFHGTYDSTPAATLPLITALHRIQRGIYRHDIAQLRTVLHTAGKTAYDMRKKALDALTFCGTFHPRRAKETLTQHSAIAHLDYDGIPHVAHAKKVLCVVPGMCYVFTSPSGQGLKVGVHIPLVADDASYKHAWQCVADYIAYQTGLVADPSGTDISRLCYVSWDTQCFVNLHASVFPVPPAPVLRTTVSNIGMVVPPPTSTGDRRQQYTQHAIDRAVRLIETSTPATSTTPGTRHRSRLKAARLLGGYVGGDLLTFDEAYRILEAVVQYHTAHLTPSMKTIADGLRFGMRTPVTFVHLEQERLAWCAARGYHIRAQE